MFTVYVSVAVPLPAIVIFPQSGAAAGVPFTAKFATAPGLPATAGVPGVAPSTKPPKTVVDKAGAKVIAPVDANVQPGGSMLSTKSAPVAKPAEELVAVMVYVAVVAPDTEIVGVLVAFTTLIFGKQALGAEAPAGGPKAVLAPPLPGREL